MRVDRVKKRLEGLHLAGKNIGLYFDVAPKLKSMFKRHVIKRKFKGFKDDIGYS